MAGCPDTPSALCNFKTFAGTADDYDWKSWTTSTEHRSFDDDELFWLLLAEDEVMQSGTVFARHLQAKRTDRPDVAPIPSGWKLLPLLCMLSEDSEFAQAAEVYWILRSGYDLVEFTTDGETEVPNYEFDNYPNATANEPVVDKEVDRLHSKGYVDFWEHIRAEAGCEHLDRPHYILPVNLLQKVNPDGSAKDRVIFDPSRPEGDSLNDQTTMLRTRYINILMAMMAMARGGSAWRADFEDSFHQIPLSLWSRTLAGFRWRGRLYAFRRGAFGFRPLPWVQQSVTIALVRATNRRMRAAGLKTGTPPTYDHEYAVNHPPTHHGGLHQHTAELPLLDDVGGFATSLKAGTFGFLIYLWVCFSVGCRCSQKPGKTVPPSQTDMVFIGYLLKFSDMTVNMEPERIERMRFTMKALMQKGWLTKHDLQSLIGCLVFLCTVLGMKTYYRSFIDLLKRCNGRFRISISDAVRHDIRKWYQLLYMFNGQTVCRGVRRLRCNYPAYSDASFTGWGFAWFTIVQDGAWPLAWAGRFGRPSKRAEPTEEERIWIGFCEACAALFTLRVILPWVGNNTMLTFYEDNQSVCSMLAKLQTTSEVCKPVITEICWLLAAYQVELDVHYIRSEDNCVADGASRLRTAKITKVQYAELIRDFCRHKPASFQAAGLFKSRPARPELLEVMDVWHPIADGAEADWHPKPPAN